MTGLLVKTDVTGDVPTSSKCVLMKVEMAPSFFHLSLPLPPSLALPSLPPSSHFLSFPRLCSSKPSVTCFSFHLLCHLPPCLHSPPRLLFSSPLFSFPLLSPLVSPSLLICSVCTDRRALHRQQWFILLRQMSVAYSMLLPFCFISTHCT